MHLFLSWSGEKSLVVAQGLKVWMEGCLPDLPVWMSERDIGPGKRWGEALHTQLRQSDLGVLCLTPDNLNSAWMMYEAGALAARSHQEGVIPFLVEVTPEALPSPLTQFQSVPASQAGAWLLLCTVAHMFDNSLTEPELRERFDRSWESLAQALGLSLEQEQHGEVMALIAQKRLFDEDDGKTLLSKVAGLLLEGHRKLLLDLTAVETVTESALGFLLSGIAVALRKQADLVVVADPDLRQTLHSSPKLKLIFRDFPTRTAALAYFAHGGEGGTADPGSGTEPLY